MKNILKNLILGIGFTFALALFAVALSNCGSNDNGGDEGPASLAGKYKFKKATLISEVTVEDQTDGSSATITLPVGTDVTDMVVGGLVGALQCDNNNDGAIDLRSDFKLFAFCDGENKDPMPGGTWSENTTRTELTLNLAPPLVPVAVSIVEKNIVVAGNDLSGDVTGMPMSGFYMETYMPSSITVPEGFKFPAALLMDVKIEYTKIS